MSLGMTYSPTVPVGWGEGAMWEDLYLEKYVMGEQEFNEKDAGFSKITIKKQLKK